MIDILYSKHLFIQEYINKKFLCLIIEIFLNYLENSSHKAKEFKHFDKFPFINSKKINHYKSKKDTKEKFNFKISSEERLKTINWKKWKILLFI